MKRSSEHGFTLVEMMVVVALIGILSAVAIPNFKKYQAKSRTTEAKLQLAALYTSEQSFFSDYKIYSVCLRLMGYEPVRETSQRYYTIGFPNIAGATINPSAYATAVTLGLASDSLLGGGCPQSTGSIEGQTFYHAGKGIGNRIAYELTVPVGSNNLTKSDSQGSSFALAARPAIGVQADDSSFTFRAVATGFIDKKYVSPGNTATDLGSSIFSINQTKLIFNPRIGY